MDFMKFPNHLPLSSMLWVEPAITLEKLCARNTWKIALVYFFNCLYILSNSKCKKVGVLPIWIVKSNVFKFPTDEGPKLETLDFAFHIDSTPTFLYFDLYLNTAYAALLQMLQSDWLCYSTSIRRYRVAPSNVTRPSFSQKTMLILLKK